MDDEKDQVNVPPETPELPTAPEAAPVAPVASQPVVASVGGSGKKKLFIIVGVIVLVLLAAAALWYFVLRDKDTKTNGNQNQNPDTSEQTGETTLQNLPDQIAYAHSEGEDAPYKLYTRPASSGERTEVMTLPEGVFISTGVVYEKQVAFVAEPGANTQESLAIYYSGDSGKTYEKIYTGKARDTSESLGEQITSLIFSTDGKALIFGLLPADGGNQITELSLETKQVKELFTVEERGVFLEAYDRAKQKAIYFSGCYNCDGNMSKELFVYDIAAKQQETLYDSEVGLLEVAVKKDFSTVLLSEGTFDEATANELGGGVKAPYTLFALNISNKAKETLTTTDDEWVRDVGFTPEGNPYVVTTKKVIKVVNKTPSTLFETSSSISYIRGNFVGDNSVVVNIAESPNNSNFSVAYFKVGDTEPTSVLNGDASTVIFGITLK